MEHKLKKAKIQKNVVKVKEPRLPIWKLLSKLEARKKTSCEFPERASIRVSTRASQRLVLRSEALLRRVVSPASQSSTTLNEKFRLGEVLLFAYLAIFIFGCDESLQTPSGDFKVTNISTSWSKAVQIIQDGLADNDPLVRVRAIEVVASTRQLRLMPQVLRLLKDKSMPVRFATALAVGDSEYSPAKKLLNQLLKDEDSNVIIAAAYAMSRLGSFEYLEVLRKAADSDDQTVRANVALLLGKSGNKSSLELLRQILQDKDSDDRAVYQAAEAIAMLGDKQIFPKLWTMLISAYADVRLMGVRSMGKLGTPEAKNALIRMLDDDILEVRLTAAEQLGVFRDPIGEPKVLEVFEKKLTGGLDKTASERTYVLTALAIGQIRTPRLRKFLPQLLQNDSKFVRIAAAKAVFQCMN